jgi:curved DNA-binding protein
MPRSRQQRPVQYQQQVTISLDEAYHGTKRQFQSGDRLKEVTIPAGAKSGTKVRVAGAGPQGADGSSTDLILLIDVASHPDFVRKGDDLHTQVKVDVFTAILGGETQVNTLSGQVVLKIPPGTQPEQLIRISGRGMPHLKNSKQKGDLIVRIKVQIPRNLNEKQKSLLEELKKQITD